MSRRIPWAIVLFACGGREPLPPAHVGNDEDVADVAVERDPIRAEVRELQDRCADTVAALEAEVEDARSEERALTAAAAAAYVVGELADGSGDAEVMGPVGAGADSCAPGQDPAGLETRCSPTTMVPSMSHGEGGPIDRRVDEVHLDARDRVRAINRASDDLDDFLMSHPRSAGWTEAERSEWTELRNALAEQCGGRDVRR